MEEKKEIKVEEQINKEAEKTTVDDKVKKIKAEIGKNIDLNIIENLVKNNEMEFEFEDVDYRIAKPSYKQRQDAYQEQLKKHVSLLQEKDENGDFKYKSEDELKALYKARGIDIDDMTNKIVNLELKKKDYLIKLGKLLADKVGETKEVKVYKAEIEKINDAQQTLSFKKTQLLGYSLESQSLMHTYSYLTYLVTEKLVKGKDLGEGNKEADKWVRAWKSFDEFMNSPEALVNKAAFYATIIVKPDMEL